MQDMNALIWMDLEMTGLDPKENRIIEIATIVTDKNLNIIAEGPVFAIHQSDEHLAIMDDWNQRTHGESGLIERIKNSTISEKEAEKQTIEFLRQYVPKGKSPLCGNSICQDRRFLYEYMPELCDYMHYRHIDVSTIKELANRWYSARNDLFFKKDASHEALSDIRESIAELKFYREKLFSDSLVIE